MQNAVPTATPGETGIPLRISDKMYHCRWSLTNLARQFNPYKVFSSKDLGFGRRWSSTTSHAAGDGRRYCSCPPPNPPPPPRLFDFSTAVILASLWTSRRLRNYWYCVAVV